VLSILTVVEVDIDDDSDDDVPAEVDDDDDVDVDEDSHGFFAAVVAGGVVEYEFLFDEEVEDSSSEVGLDFEASEVVADGVGEAVEPVSEIFPNELPDFQLGVCFFQAGTEASFGFSSTGAKVDLPEGKTSLYYNRAMIVATIIIQISWNVLRKSKN